TIIWMPFSIAVSACIFAVANAETTLTLTPVEDGSFCCGIIADTFIYVSNLYSGFAQFSTSQFSGQVRKGVISLTGECYLSLPVFSVDGFESTLPVTNELDVLFAVRTYLGDVTVPVPDYSAHTVNLDVTQYLQTVRAPYVGFSFYERYSYPNDINM